MSKKMDRMIEILHILDFWQLIDILIFPIILLISLVIKPFLPKNIWIVAENPNEACDNGYIFFKYLREKRRKINAYYVIDKKSKDFDKVSKIGKVIQPKSLKHWIYYLNAEKIIVTQKYANPSPALFHILHKYNLIKTPRIFLQHGIIKDNAKMFYFNRTKFRIFICGAKKEYEYVKKFFNYPKGYVAYTGLARYDNLNLDKKKNNFILIYPTWRNYIKNQKEFDAFMKNYYDLINNKKLINCLEKYDIIVQLVLHKNMKKFKLNKNTKSKNIKINHNEEVDIQDLINKTDLLITDFSSLYFDIAYRQRPIIYYQFDTDNYRKKQLEEGYFSYQNNGFGKVVKKQDIVIDEIKRYVENNFKVEELYYNRMKDFFERRDSKNCERIFREIEIK